MADQVYYGAAAEYGPSIKRRRDELGILPVKALRVILRQHGFRRIPPPEIFVSDEAYRKELVRAIIEKEFGIV